MITLLDQNRVKFPDEDKIVMPGIAAMARLTHLFFLKMPFLSAFLDSA